MASVHKSKKIHGNKWLHKCNRCGYEWDSKNKKPNTCADRKCRSKYWNKPRVRPKSKKS